MTASTTTAALATPGGKDGAGTTTGLPPMSPAVQAVEMALNDGGNNFEEIMKTRNRVRREKEEYNVAELKVQITRLEDALAAETKRRVDATTSLDAKSREHVFDMEERLRKQLDEDNVKIQTRLDELDRRMTELEMKFEKESSQQLQSIQHKAEEWNGRLEKFKQEQDAERRSRLKREGRLLAQVESHASEFEERWNLERQQRMEQIQALESKVVHHEIRQQSELETFQARVQEELELLKKELDIETQERQEQDDEIVQALNRYTQQLQHSLSVLTAD